MCQYFSCIVTRDLKVHWNKKTCNHEDLIAELKLTDTKLIDRDFVRIEVYPNNIHSLTRNPQDWTYKVDEEGTVPTWYKKAQKTIEASVWASWTESVKTQITIGAENGNVTDTYLLVQSCSSKVVARGSSTVEAYGSSTVVAWGSSKVEARGSSKVEARGSSKVEAYDSSKVEAYDSSTVEAYDSSTVEAYDSSKVEINSSSSVVLCHRKIIVNPLATVIVKKSFTASEVSY